MKTETAKLKVDANATPTVEAPKAKEELTQVFIDREMTDGGIRVNGKLYVGNVKVTQGQAEDLLRIQEEYFETKMVSDIKIAQCYPNFKGIRPDL